MVEPTASGAVEPEHEEVNWHILIEINLRMNILAVQ